MVTTNYVSRFTKVEFINNDYWSPVEVVLDYYINLYQDFYG